MEWNNGLRMVANFALRLSKIKRVPNFLEGDHENCNNSTLYRIDNHS